MEILRVLSKRFEAGVIEVLKVKDAAKKVEERGRSDLQNKIIAVDFAETPQISDPNEAYSCVVVLTSNGRIGTISHLRTRVNVQKFVQALFQFHRGSTPACLVGGDDRDSNHLIESLRMELEKLGFGLSTSLEHNDLGGYSVGRKATLFPDRVHVKRNARSGLPVANLTFPKQLQ